MERGEPAFFASAAKTRAAGVGPNIGAVAAVLAKLDIIDVRPRSVLEDEDQLMLRPVKTSHAAVRLDPDAEVDRFEAAGERRGLQFLNVAPVHAGIDDRPRPGMAGAGVKRRVQKAGKLGLVHFADRHREFPVAHAAEAGDIRCGERRLP